jgi:hypothetical protein
MIDSAQHMADGLPQRHAPDLREIPLSDLAELVSDGDQAIQEVVGHLLGDPDTPPPVQATIFNSAI